MSAGASPPPPPGPRAAEREAGPACFSKDRVYRYWLSRRWSSAGGVANFVLLNPSTADEQRLDPTLRRCLGFAQRWGFGAMVVTNIFALRSTDPQGLRRVGDPVGPENDGHVLTQAERADLVIAGWGRHGALHGRGRAVAAMLSAELGAGRVVCLGLTGAGDPKHPLYLAASERPRPFNP